MSFCDGGLLRACFYLLWPFGAHGLSAVLHCQTESKSAFLRCCVIIVTVAVDLRFRSPKPLGGCGVVYPRKEATSTLGFLLQLIPLVQRYCLDKRRFLMAWPIDVRMSYMTFKYIL